MYGSYSYTFGRLLDGMEGALMSDAQKFEIMFSIRVNCCSLLHPENFDVTLNIRYYSEEALTF